MLKNENEDCVEEYLAKKMIIQVFYNSPQSEGLAPPRRPNFEPIYQEKQLKTRHNDKSVGGGCFRNLIYIASSLQ